MYKVERFLNQIRMWIYQKKGKFTINRLTEMEKMVRKLVNVTGIMHYALMKACEHKDWRIAKEALDLLEKYDLEIK